MDETRADSKSKSENLSELKVALVHDSLTVPGGSEQVLFELHRLFPNAPIFTPLYKSENFPQFKDADIRVSGLNRWGYARNHHQVMIPLLPYFMEQFDLSEFDVVISDSSAVAKGAITSPDTLHICYCHTPMRWAWLPQVDKRASSSVIRRLASHYLRIWDSASAKRVDVWLANSQTSAKRVKKFYGQEAAVIYPPVHVEGIVPATSHNDFYLTVGRLIPNSNKKIDVIIDAAIKTGIKLKVVGTGPMLSELKARAKGHSKIEFLGYVSNEVRDSLYATCKAFIFASEEDAGIVPVEAMAYGKPVIAYGKGGAAETVIDGKTGLHFREQTADSLALAIEAARDMEFDAEAINRHASQFSATHFREKIIKEVAHQVELWSKVTYGERKE